MAELTTLARPYARAAFEVAVESESLGIWSKDLALVAAVVGKGAVKTALSLPSLTGEKQAQMVIDLCGDEIGGAVKNVLAIACGIVEGRKLGDNTRAALVTRGLAEISRLGIAKGAKAETLAGLSGLGDLTLTCNAMQSRNFSLGVALGQGKTLEDIMGERNSVAEGVFTASSVTDLARRVNVDLPICSAVDGVLNHGADIDATINALLARPLKAETA